MHHVTMYAKGERHHRALARRADVQRVVDDLWEQIRMLTEKRPPDYLARLAVLNRSLFAATAQLEGLKRVTTSGRDGVGVAA